MLMYFLYTCINWYKQEIITKMGMGGRVQISSPINTSEIQAY